MDADVVEAIDRRLSGVESDHQVAIAWARSVTSSRRSWTTSLTSMVGILRRSAAAVRWLRSNQGAVPPMQLSALLDEAPVKRELRAEIDELIEIKAETREIGRAAFPPRILSFVRDELEAGQRHFEDGSEYATSLRTVADEFFRNELERWNATGDNSLG